MSSTPENGTAATKPANIESVLKEKRVFKPNAKFAKSARIGKSGGASTSPSPRSRPASQTKFWDPPSGHPGQAKNLFVVSTYVRGAMTLQALRDKIGTRDLLRIMRTWAAEHHHGNGDIEEFIALADRVSGRHLRGFFHRWLFERGKPQ